MRDTSTPSGLRGHARENAIRRTDSRFPLPCLFGKGWRSARGGGGRPSGRPIQKANGSSATQFYGPLEMPPNCKGRVCGPFLGSLLEVLVFMVGLHLVNEAVPVLTPAKKKTKLTSSYVKPLWITSSETLPKWRLTLTATTNVPVFLVLLCRARSSHCGKVSLSNRR